MKEIKKTWKIIGTLILLVLTSCIPSKNNCSSIENGIIEHCISENGKCQIALNQLSDVSFDNLYIFEGPRFPSEVEDVLKVEYNEVLDDGDRLYVFVKNKQITHKEISSCTNVDIHGLMNNQGYVILSHNVILYSSLQKSASETLYRVRLK